MFEQWDIPENYTELVTGGTASYSILGVVTPNNMDAMTLFLDAMGITDEQVVLDDGTQVFLKHPDPTRLIQIDSGGLGDFDRNGYTVTVVDRSAFPFMAAVMEGTAND